jgi:hypothetical protein
MAVSRGRTTIKAIKDYSPAFQSSNARESKIFQSDGLPQLRTRCERVVWNVRQQVAVEIQNGHLTQRTEGLQF